jgi:hypothetical protein
MVVSTVGAKKGDIISGLVKHDTGSGGCSLTWSLRIVGVEFGSEAGCYGHLDNEDDRVQERLQ